MLQIIKKETSLGHKNKMTNTQLNSKHKQITYYLFSNELIKPVKFIAYNVYGLFHRLKIMSD